MNKDARIRQCCALQNKGITADCIGKSPMIRCGDEACGKALDAVDFKPASKATALAREWEDFLKYGADGMKMHDVLKRQARFMVEYAEALQEG